MKSLGLADAAWAVGVLGAAVAAFFLFRTPEPARTGLLLIDLLCTPSAARGEAIGRHVLDPLQLIVPPEDAAEGELELAREELDKKIAELDVAYPGCSFRLEDWNIRPGSGGTAWLEGMLEYSNSQASDLHGRRRSLRMLFREVGGAQRLERVVLGPVERRLPEARP
jgi:hypothetical protein